MKGTSCSKPSSMLVLCTMPQIRYLLTTVGSKRDTYVFPATVIERMVPWLLKTICPGDGSQQRHGLCVRCWGLPGEDGLRRLLYNAWTEAVKNGGWPCKMQFRDLAEIVEKALPASVSCGFLQICPPSRPASSATRNANPIAQRSSSRTAPANAPTGPSNPTTPRCNVRTRIVSSSVQPSSHYPDVWSMSPTAAALPANPTRAPAHPSAVCTRRPAAAHTTPPPISLRTGPLAIRTKQPADAGPKRPAATNTAPPPITSLTSPRTYATALRDGIQHDQNNSRRSSTTLPATSPLVKSGRPSTGTTAARGRNQSGRPAAPGIPPRPGIALPTRPTALAATRTGLTTPAPRPRPGPSAAPRLTRVPVPPDLLSRVRLSLLFSSFNIPPSPDPTLAAWDALSEAAFENAGIPDSGILERLSSRRRNEWEGYVGRGDALKGMIEAKWRDELFMRVHVLRRRV